MRIIGILFLFITLTCSYANEKTLIISHHYAQPFFIELQAKTFRKFIKDDYEFVVFNDAKTRELEQEIYQLCKKYQIRCIRISPEIHNRPYLFRLKGEDYNHPCVRCANVVQYSLDILGFDYPGKVVIIDSDMFLTKPFSFVEYMNGYDLVAVPQSRDNGVKYIWNGIIMFNMPTLPNRKMMNFNCGRIDDAPVDAGGYTHYYLSKYADIIKIKEIGPAHFSHTIDDYHNGALDSNMNHLIPLIELDPPSNMETFLQGAILHYRGGGLWDPKPTSYYQRKNNCLRTYIEYILEKE
ncbi:MAG: hypothetical protein HY860_06940 [Chlamydiales bacterium]|nr:hypothetical protein [Chlamydiales bacterium]